MFADFNEKCVAVHQNNAIKKIVEYSFVFINATFSFFLFLIYYFPQPYILL